MHIHLHRMHCMGVPVDSRGGICGADSAQAGGALAGIPMTQILSTWDSAFDSDDPAEGGCPPIG
jgi:hypothetical protein